MTRDLSVLGMVKLQLKVQIRTSRTGIPSHTTSSEVEAPSYELNRDLHSYLDMVKLQLKVNIQVRTTRTKGKFTLPPNTGKLLRVSGSLRTNAKLSQVTIKKSLRLKSTI